MIGRKKEIEEFNRILNSDRAQLVAVYGRRRVGKTYLVDETFKGSLPSLIAAFTNRRSLSAEEISEIKEKIKSIEG